MEKTTGSPRESAEELSREAWEVQESRRVRKVQGVWEAQETPVAQSVSDMATTDEVAEICEQRSAMYALLARLYRREIDEECLGQLKAMRLPACTGDEAADEGYRLIAKYLCHAHVAALSDLALDYARCFIGEGMSSFSAAYPYESVHTSEKRLLMQEARDEVLALMRVEGVEKRGDFHETEDHLAVEFEFMSVLASRTAKLLRQGDVDAAENSFKTQGNFFADHVASWVPLLTAEMRKFAQTDLYVGLSYVTEGFVESEQEFFDGILADEVDA